MLTGLSGLRVERWHDEAVRRRGERPGPGTAMQVRNGVTCA